MISSKTEHKITGFTLPFARKKIAKPPPLPQQLFLMTPHPTADNYDDSPNSCQPPPPGHK